MMRPEEDLNRRLIRLFEGIVLFLVLTVVAFFSLEWLVGDSLKGSALSKGVFQLGSALLVAVLGVYAAAAFRRRPGLPISRPPWLCPVFAAALALGLMTLSYTYLGVWPLGQKSVMMVDMHHQYGPLFSELRSMLLEGGSLSYSSHMGLGANFMPAFAYYLASPLNLLMVLFPEALLAEGILVITLLKFAGAAAAFAACVQGLYRRRDADVVALALLYASTGYMLAYSWNIMWLDAVALLPAVVLCLERLLYGGRLWPYSLLLALALLASYYIGFMLCIFLVLYFIVWMLRSHRSRRSLMEGAGRFALGSLLAGGIAACVLLPTALALGRTSAAGGNFGQFTVNFPFFDLLKRLFFGATPTIRSGNLPNIYCGVVAVLLLPLYLSLREIPLRRRLTYGGLLAFLLFSCTIEPLDLGWHGLHAPNDLPYRFSFLVCFVLLLLAARVLTELPRLQPKAILSSLGGCAIYLLLWEKLAAVDDEKNAQAWLLYANLALLAVYACVLLVTVRKKWPSQVGRRLLLVAVTAELLLCNGMTLTAMDGAEHYTNHSDYVDNVTTQVNALALQRAEEIAAQSGHVGCRMEFLPRQTCMDTALHHYRGLTTFASSNPYATTLLMGELGYAINGVNSYQYNTFYSPTDSLFGLQYVILEVKLTSHPQLKLLDSVVIDGQYRYIYENIRALPLGYCVDNAVRQYEGVAYDPFSSQENFYNAITGNFTSLSIRLPLQTDGVSGSCHNSAFTKYATAESADFIAEVTMEGQYYAYVDCRAATTLTVETCTDTGSIQNSWSVTPYEPFIIDLGQLTAGQTVRTTVGGAGGLSGNIYIARALMDAVDAQLQALQDGAMDITVYEDGYIRGKVTAQAGQCLMLTVPYDKGWHVTVDGETAETFPIANNEENADGALLGISLPAGTHDVEMRYSVPGGLAGILVTVCSAAALAVITFYPRWKKRKK